MIGIFADLAGAIAAIWSTAMFFGVFGEVICKIKESDELERFWRACARVHQELWLFALPGLLGNSVHHWRSDHLKWMIVIDVISLWNWWNLRNWPEDNHWKRRGRKLRDAVKVRAGRLVVVPTT